MPPPPAEARPTKPINLVKPSTQNHASTVGVTPPVPTPDPVPKANVPGCSDIFNLASDEEDDEFKCVPAEPEADAPSATVLQPRRDDVPPSGKYATCRLR